MQLRNSTSSFPMVACIGRSLMRRRSAWVAYFTLHPDFCVTSRMEVRLIYNQWLRFKSTSIAHQQADFVNDTAAISQRVPLTRDDFESSAHLLVEVKVVMIYLQTA